MMEDTEMDKEGQERQSIEQEGRKGEEKLKKDREHLKVNLNKGS